MAAEIVADGEATEAKKPEPVFDKMDIEDSDLEEVATWQGIDAELAVELKPDGNIDVEGVQKLETAKYPVLHPPLEDEPSEKRAKAATKIRKESEKQAEALKGDPEKAIAVYTEAMRVGGSTAMMLVNRAALLLQLSRPGAAVRDCTAALKLNKNFFKAFRIRGGAHGKLGNCKKAHRDLTEAQKLKHDPTTEELQKVFAAQCKKMDPTWKEPPTVTIPDVHDIGADENPAAKPAAAVPPRALRPSVDPIIPPLVAFTPEVNLPDLDKGQAVTLTGLKAAPHLNGKRAVVERKDPRATARGRWEVELRMEGGRAEIKSLKRENIATLNKIDKEGCRSWAVEEKKWKADKAKREQLQEDFQFSKCVEGKLSKMSLSAAAQSLVRKLGPQDALNLLDRAPTTEGADVEGFITSTAQAQLDMMAKVAAFAKQAAEAAKKEITITVKPPQVLVDLKAKSGEITGVKEGQAKDAGVEPGCVIIKLDGMPYTASLLKEKHQGSAAYTMTFRKPDEPPAKRVKN